MRLSESGAVIEWLFSSCTHTRCTHELSPHPPPPLLRHVWEKSGGAIDVNTSPRLRLDPDGTLHISQTWSGDIGTYTCRVTSVGGNDSRSAHLRVRSAIVPFPPSPLPSPSILLSRLPPPPHRQLPHAPENPVALLSATEKRAINLTWAQAFDGNSPLIRYILEVSENSERRQKVPASFCRVPLLASTMALTLRPPPERFLCACGGLSSFFGLITSGRS